MGRFDQGIVLWLTGLSGSGKTTLAYMLEKELQGRRSTVEVLDGDVVRTHLSSELGFTKKDRDTNITRVGYICQLLSRNGVIAIAALISPYRQVRDDVRLKCNGRFVEVYVKCDLQVLQQRDPKGLYRKALAGEIPNFTGISDPYEEPLQPEVIVETDRETPEESCGKIMRALKDFGYLEHN